MKFRENTPPYHLLKFLRKYHKCGELLLALSGGADSLSLLYSLLSVRETLPLSFTLLHVNHQLREESTEEEKAIRQLADQLSLPLLVKHLSLGEEGNLEDRARKERYHFFETVAEERNAEALLLGHHGDDQGEIILKRMFEGSPLLRWKGMEEVSQKNGLTLYRPLLGLRKKEIVTWLESIHVIPFEDKTNLSQENLRGKMRTQLLPTLSAQFGKEIASPLLQIQREAKEQIDLLDELISSYEKGKNSLTIPPIHPTLQKHLIRKWLDENGLSLSYAALNQLIQALPSEEGSLFPTNQGFFIRLFKSKIYFDKGEELREPTHDHYSSASNCPSN